MQLVKTYTFPGKLPGMNEYTAANRNNPYTGARMKKNCQRDLELMIRSQGICHPREPVKLTYRWYERNKRRDLDNVAAFGMKVIQDALVGTGVLRDDGWKDIVGFEHMFFVDKDNPRIEVDISEDI